ncbi:hypothetical protein EV2_004370 [Malus domestica]
MADQVVLLDFWPSPFGMRVRIALAEKGVVYESPGRRLEQQEASAAQDEPCSLANPSLDPQGKTTHHCSIH